MLKLCRDCSNLAPRDVFKGYCEKNEVTVAIDADRDECSDFQLAIRCSSCRLYSPTTVEYLGKCLESHGTTYPDLPGCCSYEPGAEAAQ